MKNSKIILSLSFLLILSSCSSGAKFLTDQKEGWFRDPEFGLVYCRANVANDSADPLCVEAGFAKGK